MQRGYDMDVRTFATVVLAVSVLPTHLLQAAVIPGRWEKVDGLQEGTGIMVELKSGDLLEGAFKLASPQELTIIDLSGSDQQLPKTAVAKIVTAEKVKDGLNNGMLIGMGVGTGVAVGAVALSTGGISEECSVCGLAILLGFAGGSDMGAAIDAIHQKPEVLYQSAK
jgi:hypothetical protein